MRLLAILTHDVPTQLDRCVSQRVESCAFHREVRSLLFKDRIAAKKVHHFHMHTCRKQGKKETNHGTETTLSHTFHTPTLQSRTSYHDTFQHLLRLTQSFTSSRSRRFDPMDQGMEWKCRVYKCDVSFRAQFSIFPTSPCCTASLSFELVRMAFSNV